MTLSRGIGVLLALAITGAVGGLSQMPWSVDAGGPALIRFSWRAAGQRVEQCREPTAEDLAGLPDHMRPQEICERAMRPYQLRISVDGQLVTDQVLRAAGAQADRPIYVFVEHPVEPGAHAVRVDFRPLPGDGATADASADGAARIEPLLLDREIHIERGQIMVVTLSGDGDAFAVLGPEGS